MKIEFVEPSTFQRKRGEARPSSIRTRLANVEIIFEEGEALAGLKLVGFKLWRNLQAKQLFVTLPAHAYKNDAGQTKYSDFLRSVREEYSDTDWLRDQIVEEWGDK